MLKVFIYGRLPQNIYHECKRIRDILGYDVLFAYVDLLYLIRGSGTSLGLKKKTFLRKRGSKISTGGHVQFFHIKFIEGETHVIVNVPTSQSITSGMTVQIVC